MIDAIQSSSQWMNAVINGGKKSCTCDVGCMVLEGRFTSTRRRSGTIINTSPLSSSIVSSPPAVSPAPAPPSPPPSLSTGGRRYHHCKRQEGAKVTGNGKSKERYALQIPPVTYSLKSSEYSILLNITGRTFFNLHNNKTNRR